MKISRQHTNIVFGKGGWRGSFFGSTVKTSLLRVRKVIFGSLHCPIACQWLAWFLLSVMWSWSTHTDTLNRMSCQGISYYWHNICRICNGVSADELHVVHNTKKLFLDFILKRRLKSEKDLFSYTLFTYRGSISTEETLNLQYKAQVFPVQCYRLCCTLFLLQLTVQTW